MPRTLPLLLGLAMLGLASLALALMAGSIPLRTSQVWAALLGDGAGEAGRIVLELRLPRALTAFAVGGLLALAGSLLQVLLRNPLADPYVLGTSGGAAVGALGALLLGLGSLGLGAGAFLGALASTLLVFGLARGLYDWSSTRLLLTGIVVAAGWGALIAFLLTISPERYLRGMLFWLMGDIGDPSLPLAGLWALPLTLTAAWLLARPLDLLARGELTAASLGVAVSGVRLAVYALTALATAVSVSYAGSVGFVGLIVPHMLRLAGARSHRSLLPGAALAGGSLLVLADTAARSLFAPLQLPVGILTALIGVPAFLFLLLRQAPREVT
ncbi:iron ABC transporter permease [Thiohalobacter sp. IOR34]|uniref:FecCD family ABC transporter permease n=1 Tax=Thiohalobacter sp. IOR34 TaxID=3057176 RepID=UPI0025B0691E|nr:iron ABC transporter permease [Thiohalobacter sp. IOR34]WJW76855.1 iron ABC transporter permease [Thiohalobacter sp. IOR34]